MKFQIGNNSFKSKKEATEFYKEILAKYSTSDRLIEKDKNSVLELLKLHEDSEQYFSKEIEAICIVEDPKFKSKCFAILNVDNEIIIFSYRSCISGGESPLNKFRKACRNIIDNDLHKIKKQYFGNNSVKRLAPCQESGEMCTWEELVIDHRQPNTFSMIVDRFIELNSIDLTKVEYNKLYDKVYEFSSVQLQDSFREYHKDKANLRIIKKTINSSRAHQGRNKRQKKDLVIK
jgi:hypothetical protein